MSTDVTTAVGTFVWRENVSTDPQRAQAFYTSSSFPSARRPTLERALSHTLPMTFFTIPYVCFSST